MMTCARCVRNDAERAGRPDRVRDLEAELAACRTALSVYTNGTSDGGRRAREALGVPERTPEVHDPEEEYRARALEEADRYARSMRNIIASRG